MPEDSSWRGGPVDGPGQGTTGASIRCVLAPNPGPMTLEGTNSWLLAAPGSRRAVLIDPGPDDETHLDAILATAAVHDLSVDLVLLTHGHLDHSAGARPCHHRTGAPVRALDPAHAFGAEGLRGGEVIDVGGLRLDVVATPGHSGDSLCLLLPDRRAVLTGDTVLGRGSTVVAHPDGRLADYLASLRRLERLAAERELELVLPGHGPPLAVPDAPPVAVLRQYLEHRAQRLAQVAAAVADGATSPEDVVRRVYADVPQSLWPAAGRSVRAQLDYLAGR